MTKQSPALTLSATAAGARVAGDIDALHDELIRCEDALCIIEQQLRLLENLADLAGCGAPQQGLSQLEALAWTFNNLAGQVSQVARDVGEAAQCQQRIAAVLCSDAQACQTPAGKRGKPARGGQA